MRKRKPRVVWLPTTPANSVDNAGVSTWSTFNFAVNAGTGAAGSGVEIPIVLDGTQSDPLNINSSLSDIENSGYRLRRIVGGVWIFIAQNNTATEDIFGVTAGFMVRRVDATGGSLASSAGFSEFDCDDVDNSMDPWIWRRSWILSNGPTGGTSLPPNADELASIVHRGPSFNYGPASGNAFEGAHVDQKTARIVGPEERLFLDVSCIALNSSGANTSIVGFTNLRVLGSMRVSAGNRRNASR